MGQMQTVRFSYNLISLAASSKVSLKDDIYERQPGRTVGQCTPIVQVMTVVLAVPQSNI